MDQYFDKNVGLRYNYIIEMKNTLAAKFKGKLTFKVLENDLCKLRISWYDHLPFIHNKPLYIKPDIYLTVSSHSSAKVESDHSAEAKHYKIFNISESFNTSVLSKKDNDALGKLELVIQTIDLVVDHRLFELYYDTREGRLFSILYTGILTDIARHYHKKAFLATIHIYGNSFRDGAIASTSFHVYANVIGYSQLAFNITVSIVNRYKKQNKRLELLMYQPAYLTFQYHENDSKHVQPLDIYTTRKKIINYSVGTETKGLYVEPIYIINNQN